MEFVVQQSDSRSLLAALPLRGRSIVIVGGTSGLGLAAARACTAAGATVVVVGRQPGKCAAAEQELGAACRSVTGDAVHASTAEEAIRLAVDSWGSVAGLYHVAGGSGRRHGDGPLDQITNTGWESTLRNNLTALFHSNRAATQQFLRQGSGGSILNMSSVLAFSPSPRFFATHAYAAAKAAVIGLTKSSAAYYAPQQIRFNVVCPALVDTPMAQRAVADEATLNYVRTKQPLDGGRVGDPTDLDAAVVYFLSDASRFVTGQVLAIDGGWSVAEGQA